MNTQTMTEKKWTLSDDNSYITDENGNLVLTFDDNVSKSDKLTIEALPQAFQLIQSFVENVRNGNYKPRTTVKQFETFLEKFEI